jgi:hypothetical protein
MQLNLLAVALTAALAPLVSAQKKAVINPSLDMDKFETPFKTAWPVTAHTIQQWPAGHTTAKCKDWAIAHNLTVTDFELFEVTYDDCSVPWIMCRHKEAPPSQEEMADVCAVYSL